jgi:hypothetical protein
MIAAGRSPARREFGVSAGRFHGRNELRLFPPDPP